MNRAKRIGRDDAISIAMRVRRVHLLPRLRAAARIAASLNMDAPGRSLGHIA
jgi:hypothetical protein